MSYTPKKKRFLNAREVDETIVEVAILARQEHVRIALLGGAAMQIYGSDRLTTDVDFVADDTFTLKDAHELSFGGVRGLAPNGIPVDLIVRQDDYAELYVEALRTAQPVDGLEIPVVLPEFLAAMKLAAWRPKDEGDLQTLILSGELDIKAARVVIRSFMGHHAAENFDRVVYEIEWRSSNEKK